MIRLMSKEKILSLLKDKNNGIIIDSYTTLSKKSGYSVRQLKRYAKLIEEKDTEELMIHGNSGKKPAITVPDQEISYIVNFKLQYPSITIAQFKDIYDEDIVLNPKKKKDVDKYGLKIRSMSFFRSLYIKYKWKSPVMY